MWAVKPLITVVIFKPSVPMLAASQLFKGEIEILLILLALS